MKDITFQVYRNKETGQTVKDIKFRRVYKNKETGKVGFIYVLLPGNGGEIVEHCMDNDLFFALNFSLVVREDKYEFLGQDLYILEDSDGNEIYENDVVESYFKIDGKDEGCDEKYKDRTLINPDLQSSNDWTYNIYGWALKDVNINKDYYICRKTGSKYEGETRE